MTQLQVSPSVNEWLQHEPEFVEQWLQEIENGGIDLQDEFNWHGLAQGAVSLAQKFAVEDNRQRSLQWAGVAIALYERLIHKMPVPQHNSLDNNSFVQSAMNLRVRMMRTWGTCPKHLVLDPSIVIDWFSRQISQSAEEIKREAEPWQRPGIFQDRQYIANHLETLKHLRCLKNRLNVIEPLLGLNNWQPPEELKTWVSLKPLLP